MKWAARRLGELVLFGTLGLLGFVGLWAVVLYALPLLQGWWGFVAATALVAVIVVAFDMDH